MKRGLSIFSVVFFLLFLTLAPVPGFGAIFGDDHSVEDIVKAIQTPISKEELSRARDADDQLLSTGDFLGVKGYLVTDPRYTELVSEVMENLLRAMGEDAGKWVIRIVDTDPPMVNAFVTGGKYVYVFKPLLDEGASGAELAFILAHELGHSYLHHATRQENSDTGALADLADIIALATGGQEGLQKSRRITQAFRGAFSQNSEMEADTFAAVLAIHTGYNPVRGADFFTRQSRQMDEYLKTKTQELQAERVQVEQALTYCQQYRQVFETRGGYQNQANMQQVCADAENRRIAYNDRVKEVEAEQANTGNSIYASHPSNQNRVAFIVAVKDYLEGKRDLASLKKNYTQAFRVITALQRVESPLLGAAANEAVPQSPVLTGSQADSVSSGGGDIKDKLRELKEFFDEGLITGEEYARKKKELLDRF